ncbi:hypothetical protein LMG27198_17370 [Methylocystis echinoides]|uniref:Uncharacterized protein n=1 Tax=Methylocystis echinoides TaxID=29468 RepID=A0A9W6GTU5_9HYPH|nr:hypothetical protein LMG27198_17370 [Methylocystis echinoides]
MRRAHRIRRRSGAPWAMCLRESWRIAKEAEARPLLEAATFAATMGARQCAAF